MSYRIATSRVVLLSSLPRRASTGLITILISCMLAVAGKTEAVAFRTAPSYPAGSSDVAVVVADFDQDSRQDVALADDVSNAVLLLRGDGTGSFGPPASFPLGAKPTGMASGDFNGDGRPDLVVAGAAGGVEVLLGDGALGFSAPVSYAAGSSAGGVAVGDFNGDGKADLAVVNPPGGVSILLGDGAGGFEAPLTVPVDGLTGPIAVGDMNGDGHADLVLGANGESGGGNPLGRVAVLLGDGAAGFAPAALAPCHGYLVSLVLADLNGDGRLDVVAQGIAAFDEDFGTLSVLLGDGAGGLGPATSNGEFGYSSPLGLAVVDFNGDAKPDVAVFENNVVSLYAGDGTGNLGPRKGFDAGGFLSYGPLAAGDFNGDGKADLAVARGPLEVLLGNGALGFPQAADVVFVSPSGSGAPVAIDELNGDSKPDLIGSKGLDSFAILLGGGDGTFGPPAAYTVGNIFGSVAVGDLNLDGKADLAASQFVSNEIVTFVGDGAGGFSEASSFQAGGLNPFQFLLGGFGAGSHLEFVVAEQSSLRVFMPSGALAHTYELGGNLVALAAADFNQDGHLDVVVADGTTGGQPRILVLLGDGVGGFGPPTILDTPGTNFAVAAADLNADGSPDIVVGGNAISVYIGDGAGGFVRSDIPVQARAVAIADLNLDHIPDLAVVGDTAGTGFSILLGDGSGAFASPLALPGSGVPFAADFDGDGRMDLAMSRGPGIGIFMNVTPPPAETDVAIAIDDGTTQVVPGLPVTYTITATNHGQVPITSLWITRTIPAELLGLVYTPSTGSFDVASGLWTGLDLAPGGSATLALGATLSQSATGDITTSVHVNPPGLVDTVPGNNAASDTDAVTPGADLALTQTDSADPVHALDPFSYTLTVANDAGSTPATNVMLTDALPAAVTFVSSSPGSPTCTFASRTLSCALGTLAVGGSSVVTVNVTANDYTEAVNTASVTSDVFDPVASNNSATEHTQILVGIGDELTHGSSATRDLSGGSNLFRIGQAPRSSYEVVVDAATGDLATGLSLQRLAPDLTTVLQSAVPATSGSSLSLRFENATTGREDGDPIRVMNPGCTTACGPEDTYRIRAYETTASMVRFNNSGTQVSVLILQNLAAYPIAGHVWLWDAQGTLVGSLNFGLDPHGLFVLNTQTIAPGQSGSITVSHDGRYGDLSGKGVSLEPATGFTFDNPLQLRPR